MANLLEDQQEKCWVCYEYFHDSLPVLHIFCKDCIAGGRKRLGVNTRMFVCPVCRTCMEVPQIETDGSDVTTPKHTCAENQMMQQNTMCSKCGEILCLSCSDVHMGDLWSSGAQELSVEEIFNLSARSCVKEKEIETSFITKWDRMDDIELFCEQCSAPLCVLSKESQFRNSSQRAEDKVSCLMSSLEHKVVELDDVLEHGKDILNHVDTDVKHVRNEIVKWFEEKKNSLLKKLDSESKQAIEQVNFELEEASSKRVAVVNTVKCVKHTLETSEPSDRVIECQNLIPRLLELNHQVAIIHSHKPVFAFRRGGSPDVKVDVEVRLESALESRLLGAKEPPVLCEAMLVKTFNTVLDVDDNKGSCWGITLNQGKYMTTDWKKGVVKVFSMEGDFQQLLSDGEHKLECPVDVSVDPTTDETVVTDDGIKGVVIYDKNLRQIKALKNVYKGWGSVSCRNGRVCVAGGGRITTIEKDETVANITKNSLGLDEFSPLHVTTDNYGNMITIDRSEQSIYKLSPSGNEIIDVYPPNDTITLSKPRGVCVDEWGHVIVIDGESPGFLHVISASGARSLILPTTGDVLTNPRGIVYCGNGEVAILQILGRVNVYKYMDL